MLKFINRKKYLIGIFSSFLMVVVSFQNCAKLDITNLESASKQGVTAIPDDQTPVSDSSTTSIRIEEAGGFVCSPFGATTNQSEKSGLKAELRFLDQGANLTTSQKNSILATQYFNDQDSNFIKKPEVVFLNDVNVPTRIFNQGFEGSDGKVLEDNQGHALIEYFALKMDSVLKLTDTDPEGFYELASIADDGSVVQIKQDDHWVTVISNDGAHSTKMGCMDHKIVLNKTTRLPIRIIYNQGPREQIANVLVWNYRGPAANTAANVSSDSSIHGYCGKASTDQFWSSNSQEGAWITDLKSKGWKVVANGNFQLPDNEINPCAYSKYDVPPVITYKSISNSNKAITIETADSTIITVGLYLMHTDGSKELINTHTLPEDVKHVFETGDLILDQKYQLDVIMQIPAKKIKVLKSYTAVLY